MSDVTIVIGSESDKTKITPLEDKLNELDINFETFVYSAHRNLKDLLAFLEKNQTKVYIAAAGLAAALPGTVASQVKQPVIGVPLEVGSLSGIDALLAILQMPKGIPLATMGIGKQGLINAALLAERIIKV